MILALLASSWAAQVLLVTTPGVSLEAYTPLLTALKTAGHTVSAFTVPCSDQGRVALVAQLVAAPPAEVVVAHGLGATLALMAAPQRSEPLVLLAPVLGVQAPEGSALAWLANRELAPSVRLDAPPAMAWSRDHGVAEVLLGQGLALGCVPRPFAVELQGWIRQGTVPLDLSLVSQPVWLAVSLGDDLASVETTVPASRALPQRRLLRMGVNRLDPVDYSHAQMLSAPAPIRAAVRAVADAVAP